MSTNAHLDESRERKDNTSNSIDDNDNERLTSLFLQQAQDRDMDTSDDNSNRSDDHSSSTSADDVVVTEVRPAAPISFGSPPIEGSKSMLIATLGRGGNKNAKTKRKLVCVSNEYNDKEEGVGELSKLSPNSEWINKRDSIFPAALQVAQDLCNRQLELSREAVPVPQKLLTHKHDLEDLFLCSDYQSFQKLQLSLLRDNFVSYDTFYVSPRSMCSTQNREAMCTHCLYHIRTNVSKSPPVVMNERKALVVHLRVCVHFLRNFKMTSLTQRHYTALFMKEPNKDWDKHYKKSSSQQSQKKASSVTSLFQTTSMSRKPKKGKDATQFSYSNMRSRKESPGDTTISTKANMVQPPITLYAHPSWKKGEKKALDNLMLEFVIDCAVPFHIVERQSFHRLLDAIRPGTSDAIPKRTKLGTSLLNQAAEEAVRNNSFLMVERITKGHSFGMVMDSWSNIKKEHIEAVAACFGSATFLVESIKETRGIHNGVYIAHQWELLMFRLQGYMESIFQQHKDDVAIYMNVAERQYLRCNYMNTDSAGQCGRAKRILSRKYPHRLFLPCWAHQVNLMVRFVVNLAGMKEVFAQAVLAANDLRASSSKFLVMITNICENLYGKKAPCAIRTVAETRWNSAQACLASLLRIRTACRRFTDDKSDYNGFCNSWSVFSSDDFWTDLLCIELMIRPLCDASFLMQRKKNTLAHVMLMLMNIFHHLQYASDLFDDSKIKASYKKRNAAAENTSKLVADLERRWREVDNHVYFLAFALHPLYRNVAIRIIENSQSSHGNWTEDQNQLSVTRLVHAAKCYYFKFQLLLNFKQVDEDLPEEIIHERYVNETTKLGKYFTQWLRGTSMVGITADYDAVSDDPVEWWSNLLVEYGPLANLAMFLLDAPVQSATCEEIFKHYASFHTKKRNQLGSRKVYMMTQVKYNMKTKYGSQQETNKENNVNRQKNKAVSPVENKKVIAENEELQSLDEDVELQTGYSLEDEDVSPVEVEEWLDSLEEMDDDDEKETTQEEDLTVGDDTDLTLDFFSIDTYSDREYNDDLEEGRRWPDWTKYDGHNTFLEWPQDNPSHRKKLKQKYGTSYVRTDKYTLARICNSWKDSSEGFPSMEGSYGQEYTKPS